MSKDPKVIARAGNHRILSDGTAEQRVPGTDTEWGEPVRMYQYHQDLAALLADAVRWVCIQADRDRVVVEGLTERIEAVENRIDQQWVASNNSLAYRVTALERSMPYAKEFYNSEPAKVLPHAITKIRRETAFIPLDGHRAAERKLEGNVKS